MIRVAPAVQRALLADSTALLLITGECSPIAWLATGASLCAAGLWSLQSSSVPVARPARQAPPGIRSDLHHGDSGAHPASRDVVRARLEEKVGLVQDSGEERSSPRPRLSSPPRAVSATDLGSSASHRSDRPVTPVGFSGRAGRALSAGARAIAGL